ncbi:hypothetical protein KGF57_003746 [Candida theae]|uniref:Phospholipid/glycerol acyltransferase domain-containing protein n=1 Tax=Candida theae TaxID=1198502 RepID=A0AAD5BCQ9_9ASCO|nr:uncharacterized protein KGF57_003746 [Candida theae]KAI5954723.1 hypothetical protein KGF57_003746 [Candida theae]
MEKFSNWRDRATGLSPFMPIPFPNSTKNKPKSTNNLFPTDFIYRLVLFCTKLPIFLTKLPFFTVASILYTLTGLHIFLKFIFTFLFGFSPIEYAVDGVKSSQVDKLKSYKPQRGDLVIANYTSPLDGYILASISQTSRITILVPDKSGNLYQYSPWTLIDHCVNQIQGPPVDDVSKLKNEIVVLLLEGTTSNNTALLPFIKLSSKYSWESFTRVKSVVIKLYPTYFTLPIPNCSSLYYLYQLFTDFGRKYTRVKVYEFDNSISSTGQLDLSKIRRSFELNSLSLINQDLSIDAKARFIDYYFNHGVK